MEDTPTNIKSELTDEGSDPAVVFEIKPVELIISEFKVAEATWRSN